MPELAPPDFHIDAKRPHLGGYIEGGDPATYYPDLWAWLVRIEGVRSVIDIGCGEGHALAYFRDLGCRVLGVDGIAQDRSGILLHDFTTGPMPRVPGGFFDLAWSCEFVEHVEERYIRNFLPTFREAGMVLMTHADVGQPGHHHVNCRPAHYWIGVMAAAGFTYDHAFTDAARQMASLNRDPLNHFARSGLAFRRTT